MDDSLTVEHPDVGAFRCFANGDGVAKLLSAADL